MSTPSGSLPPLLKKLLLLLCLLAGGSVLLWYAFDGFDTTRSYLSARHWEATPCKIAHTHLTQHRIKTGRRGKTTQYLLSVGYSYDYEGRRCTSRRYALGDAHYGKEEAQTRLRELQSTPAPTCYVNPENPRQATIDRSPDNAELITQLLGCGAMVAACIALAFGGTPRRKKEKPTRSRAR